MALEQQVMEQLKQAMKDKNEIALVTLRAIKSAILIEKTAVAGKDSLTEVEEMQLLQKMVKQRNDSLAIYMEQNRQDLADKEIAELNILKTFLPQQMTTEELTAAIKQIITQVGASSKADLGKVMGVASKQLMGKAEGKAIADTVKSLLD